MVVSSALVSYAGATSTISAETMWRPSKPRKMVRNSRVDQPPVSGVPVAGANAGSIESICISAENEQAIKTPREFDDSAGLTHIDGEINGPIANRFADLLDDSRSTCVYEIRSTFSLHTSVSRTNSVNLPGFDTLEPGLVVIYVVRRARQCRANRAVLPKQSSLGSRRVRTQCPKKREGRRGGRDEERYTCNGASVRDESLATCPVKVRSVVDRRLLARRAPEHARLPRVEVRVKVDDGDRAVRAVDRAEERQHDGVVPSERDHARVVLSVLGEGHERCARQRVVRQRRERRAVQQLSVSRLDLLDRVRVVVWRHGYVPAIDDLQPGQKRVDLQRHVVPAVQRQAARPCADPGWPEACSGSVRRAGVLPVPVR